MIGKFECYIHSLKKDGVSQKGVAAIIRQIGDNDYLAEYNGVQCHAIFNIFVGMYYVDDIYGIIREGEND